MTVPPQESAKQAYDLYAPAYDDFNHGYMYERWTGRLLASAERKGLTGDRLLDVGCGTGLSFIPMLARGWKVTGCDISPMMLSIARAKAGDSATLLEADMRLLPRLGEFDLIWAVNDAMNYLLGMEELESTLAGMAQNLAPGGIVLFDLNTLTTYRSFFSSEKVVEHNGRRFIWHGRMVADEISPGSINEADFVAEGEARVAHTHRQRHFSEEEVLSALAAARLRPIAVMGELDGDLYDGLSEETHTKAVYLAGHAS